jgi:pimeloyl-ACP methyl ester carboxylesterase
MQRKTWACLLTAFVLAPAASGADGPADALDKAPPRFAKSGDLRVHYRSLGRGDTALVFVHGWTCDLTFWRAQVPAFAGKARLILIDLPGHGQSDKPKVEYTMDLFARAVHAVLADAGVKDAVLIGHSMGTPVVRQFYRLYPKQTRALVAVDGPLRQFTTDPAVAEKVIAPFRGDDYKERLGKFADSMRLPAESRDRLKAVMQATPQHVVVGAMKGMFDPAVWKEDKIEVPLQVILAPNPFMWSGDYERFVRKLAPQVDYRTLPGVSHFLMLEKPDAFNAALAEFLKKQGVIK